MRKERFNLEAFARAMEVECVKSVRKELNLEVPLDRQEIYLIAAALRKFDRGEFKRYIGQLKGEFWIASEQGISMVRINPRFQWIIIMAIEAFGSSKEEYELCRRLVGWYGIERARMKVFKEFIPQDNRDGIYTKEYDGTTREDFTLDNIGLCFMDRQAMESAIENNKWNADKLRIV
jgi:hypothetical protein